MIKQVSLLLLLLFSYLGFSQGLSTNDFDGDGVTDAIDLDDDNDGILDADECLQQIGLVENGDFSRWIFSAGWTRNGNQWNMNPNPGRGWFPPWNGLGSGAISQTINVSTFTENTLILDVGSNANNSGNATLVIKIDGVTYFSQTSAAMVAQNGGNAVGYNATLNMGERTFSFLSTSATVTLVIEGLSSNYNHDEFYIDNVILETGCSDLDGDGVPNFLDLDTDNDGIYDAIEAGHNVSNTGGRLLGSVGADGVPDAVQNAGAEDSGIVNYTLLNTDGTTAENFGEADSDGDGCADVLEAGFTEDPNAPNQLQGSGIEPTTGVVTGNSDGYQTPADSNSNNIYDYLEQGSPPIITTQPQDLGVAAAGNAIFSVIAAGSSLGYQWEVSTDGGINFTNISGETTGTLNLPGVTTNENGNLYRVLVTDLSYRCEPEISHFALLQIVSDFDNDGVIDTEDLDDDNDGILDEVEATHCNPSGSQVEVTIFSEDFGEAVGARVSTAYTTYGFEDGTGSAGFDSDLQDGEYTIFEDISTTASWAGRDWQSVGDHTTGNDRMMLVNADNTPGEEFYRRTLVEVVANVPLDISFWVMNLDKDSAEYDDRTEPDITAFISQGGVTVYSFDTGPVAREPDGDPNAWKQFIGSFTSNTNTALELVLINNAPGGSGNDLALDDIKVIQSFCDTDNDGISNSLEVDSDNDGCSDTDEAYGSFGVDVDGNGNYGSGYPASVNADGTVIGASYAMPVDGNANSLYDYVENRAAPEITITPLDADICLGCSATFEITATEVDHYQWQIYNGSVWVDLTDSGIYSGSSSNALLITNPTIAENGNQYRVIISNSGNICSHFETSISTTLEVKVNSVVTNRRITIRANRN